MKVMEKGRMETKDEFGCVQQYVDGLAPASEARAR